MYMADIYMFNNEDNYEYFYLFPGDDALQCNTKLFCNLNIGTNSILKIHRV
jgi:hypothetical protein